MYTIPYFHWQGGGGINFKTVKLLKWRGKIEKGGKGKSEREKKGGKKEKKEKKEKNGKKGKIGKIV